MTRALDVKRFGGPLVLRLAAGRQPARHSTMAEAEAAAADLLVQYPEATVIIAREVGRVKLKPVNPDALTGCADDQQFAGVSIDAARKAAERL